MTLNIQQLVNNQY